MNITEGVCKLAYRTNRVDNDIHIGYDKHQH